MQQQRRIAARERRGAGHGSIVLDPRRLDDHIREISILEGRNLSQWNLALIDGDTAKIFDHPAGLRREA